MAAWKKGIWNERDKNSEIVYDGKESKSRLQRPKIGVCNKQRGASGIEARARAVLKIVLKLEVHGGRWNGEIFGQLPDQGKIVKGSKIRKSLTDGITSIGRQTKELVIKLNPEKTQLMTIKRKGNDRKSIMKKFKQEEQRVNDEEISAVEKLNYLGKELDKTGGTRSHTESVCKKAGGAFGRVRWLLSNKNMGMDVKDSSTQH